MKFRKIHHAAMLCLMTQLAVVGPTIGQTASVNSGKSAGGAVSTVRDRGNLAGTITDGTNNRPLEGGDIRVSSSGTVVASSPSDQFGHYTIHNLSAGEYRAIASFIGFAPETLKVVISSGGGTTTVDFHLLPTTIVLPSSSVTAQAPIAIDTRSGNQVFQQNLYHGPPTNTTSQILQESMAGAVRAPTGEVHIRGQHAEYTYYLDGVPVPSGISGSLNELFDPSVVNRIEFQTGGWDAEFGGKNAAVINVLTRIPTGSGGFSSYVGSFNTNGQSFNLGKNSGKWGWLISGSRQETAMRQEPVVADSATQKPINFHNYGKDYSGFGKLQFVPTSNDVFNLDANWSQTSFQVPYDSTGGAYADDHNRDRNSFVNLIWRHQFSHDQTGQERGAELASALYYRHGSLMYTPGANDDPAFVFYPDTLLYNLSEDRSFNTVGVKADYRWRPVHEAEFKVGGGYSGTTGNENFTTTDASGNSGPVSVAKLKGHDLGIYGQASLSPREWVELRAGLRYDQHVAPFAGTQSQVSPRIKLSLYPDPTNTIYVYFGRLFIPTNVEDLRAVTSVADSGVVAAPTIPERDDFYEAGFIHRFAVGVQTKVTVYHKSSSPGIDDNTVPGSAITTSVNLDKVKITGVEMVTEIRPNGPISGYLNAALCHAYGRGPITGGFFPTDVADVPGGWFDLDHDQRLSIVANATYSLKRFYVSGTWNFGSGLTNGADITQPIGKGLLDYNRDIHVDANYIVNVSLGYSFVIGRTAIHPQVYVSNLTDRKYALKGAFFSGASWGRPRAFQAKVDVGL